MTRLQEELAERLAAELRGGTKRELVEDLMARGLLDATACDRFVMLRRFEELERGGMRRVEAMECVAEHCCCSYEKVRAAVYKKY